MKTQIYIFSLQVNGVFVRTDFPKIWKIFEAFGLTISYWPKPLISDELREPEVLKQHRGHQQGVPCCCS